MRLSQTATYALQALVTLAELPAGDSATVDELAERLDRPRNYLSKILHRLAQVGLLESTRGPGGGFRLAKPPGDVTLDEVVGHFDSMPSEPVCLLGWARCGEDAPCPAHEHWARVSGEIQSFFVRTCLADLARHGK